MIFLIVLSHMEFLRRCSFGGTYDLYWHNSTLAVDYFFLLSGFGMMYSFLKHGGLSTTGGVDVHFVSIGFAKAKVRKLYPLYAITMLAFVPMMFVQGLLHGKSLLMNLGGIVAKGALCAPLVQSAFGMTRLSHAFNGVCWFLSTLVLIYVMSPWLMVRVAKMRRIGLALLGVPVLVAVLQTILAAVDARVSFLDDLAYGSPYMRVWFVIYGMVLGRVIFTWRKRNHVPAWLPRAEIAAAMLCIGWFFLRNTFVGMGAVGGALRLVDVALCAGLLFTLSFERGCVSRLLERPRFMRLGHLAMYIYLIHYLLRMYWEPVVMKRLLGNQAGVYGDVIGIVSVVLIVALTMLLSIAWDRYRRTRQVAGGA